MKLSEWAKQNNMSYATCYRWYREGKLPVKTYKSSSGAIFVEDEVKAFGDKEQFNDDYMINLLTTVTQFTLQNKSIIEFFVYLLKNFKLVPKNLNPTNMNFVNSKDHFKKIVDSIMPETNVKKLKELKENFKLRKDGEKFLEGIDLLEVENQGSFKRIDNEVIVQDLGVK
ncbi:MAG: hypothetical protein LC122_12785 [Chitinophagales bacterium]|nr:hypothetical protein [Chitinophagales bacterium]